MLIEHGELICGILSKDTLGNKTGSLMHVIAAEFGYDTARDFYGNIQKVTNNFLMIEGHSIGIGDTIADTFTYNDIQRTIRQAKVSMLMADSLLGGGGGGLSFFINLFWRFPFIWYFVCSLFFCVSY